MDYTDKKRFPHGAITALITPFENGRVDITSFKAMIMRQINSGIEGIVVLGTTGESSTVSQKERELLISTCVECAGGKAFIIAGCGGADTKAAAESARVAHKQGANGILTVTPYYTKPSQKGLIYHYLSVAEASDAPVMMYNVPSRTGVNIETETARVLFAHENITALKEASTDISDVTDKLVKLSGDIYCGNDHLLVPFLSLGARGCVSVVSNAIPGFVQGICRTADTDEDRRLMLERIYPLIKALSLDTNPCGIKSLMSALGYCKNELRLPLVKTPSDISGAIFDAYIRSGIADQTI